MPASPASFTPPADWLTLSRRSAGRRKPEDLLRGLLQLQRDRFGAGHPSVAGAMVIWRTFSIDAAD